LCSDVTLGVFLSSGVDSAAVANVGQAMSTEPLNTFTLAFEERGHSEAEQAKAVAAAIGTNHTEVVLTGSEVRQGLLQAVRTLDQPTFDGLNTMYMAQAVRQAGLKVALVGTGGDELFGGYTTFRDLPRLRRLLGGPFVPAHMRAVAARLADRAPLGRGPVPPQSRWSKLPGMVAASVDLVAMYQLSYALFLPEFQRSLLDATVQPWSDGLPLAVAAELRSMVEGRRSLPALSRLEQRMFLGERLLRDSDAARLSGTSLSDARLCCAPSVWRVWIPASSAARSAASSCRWNRGCGATSAALSGTCC
jgi:asparagine synthase (glutamine-hydrolysing)